MFHRVAIIGPGLIGGSIGMCLRRRGLAESVIGIGRREGSLKSAAEMGAIDEWTLDPAEGVAGAELVILATPSSAFAHLTSDVAPALSDGAILTDVASTKGSVVRTIASALRERPDVSYVPTHPMAGREQRGPRAARGDLFEGAACIITPLSESEGDAQERVAAMWRAFGARIVSMSPREHDRLVARISHVPHLAAAALVELVGEEQAGLCGGGLRDTTRVASGDPGLWADICASNREEIHAALEHYIELLRRAAQRLDSEDADGLRRMLARAKEKRDRAIDPNQP